jgi:hypothetical protein
MLTSPSHLIHKTINSADPLRAYGRPSGGLYRAAAWVRDMPVAHPVGSLAVLGVGVLATPLLPAIGIGYAAAAAYSTGSEAIAAVPGAIRALEQIGRGRPEFTAPMVDTRAAMSMRQASLRAMHDSGWFLKSVLGQEGRAQHR